MRWNHSALDALSRRLDPLADAAADAVFDAAWQARLVDHLTLAPHDADPLPEGLPPAAAALLNTPLPPWADPERLAAGQSLFLRYPVPVVQTLLVRSLPEVYACAPIAAVLIRSQRLEDGVPRRLGETLQFFFDVASPHGFHQPGAPQAGGVGAGDARAGGRGRRTTLRVRLLHATIRRLILQRLTPHGAAPTIEPVNHHPINQEDLAATLVSFSAFILDGLERWGVDLSEAEQDGWMHLWDVTGHLLGVETRFESRSDAVDYFELVRARHHRRTEHGPRLTRALLDFCDTLLPGTGLDGLNPSVFRHLSGDALADLLDVGPADWTGRLIGPYRRVVGALDTLQDHSTLAQQACAAVGEAWIQGVIRRRLPDGRARFLLPDTLTG